MSALVPATGAEKRDLFYLGQFSTKEDTRTAFRSEPIFINSSSPNWTSEIVLRVNFWGSLCTGVNSLEACQHQIDLIPKRPIPPVLEPEPIRFTVTSFQLNNRGSPNSGPNSKARSPNSSLQGLTPAAWIIRVDQAPLQRPINGGGVQIPQTLPGWSC